MTHFALITAGSTIERTTWAVPAHYTSGAEFDTFAEALAHAIQQREDQIDRYREFHGARLARVHPHPERIDVDLRWIIRGPDGTSWDTAVERRTFHMLTDARAALRLAERFAH